ncbi:MAG: type II/IV secretion system ATPase subunit [Chloroflexi bacterium]|nr:type II/IV secretion system ATPase subunit [Chloroflexota bacterium]
MAVMTFPFTLEDSAEAHGGDPYACTLYKMLPKPMQETTRENVHLLEYLHMVPVNEVGIPEYYKQLSGKLRDKKKLNLIYPVEGGIYIHIIQDPEGGRSFYIAIEPKLSEGLDEAELSGRIELALLDYAMEFEGVETPEEKQEVLENIIGRICKTKSDNGGGGGPLAILKKLFKGKASKSIRLTERDLKVAKYIVVRDKLGMGILEPMIRDTNIEDISCSGLGPLFIEHKVFKSLRTSAEFTTDEELDGFVVRLSERIKKPVTFRQPIVDASLPDGSRINIVYGGDVSRRGSNFTIRKFTDTPISLLQLCEFGSMNFMMGAYLSLALEHGMNIFVSGETASGKTTLLNAMTVFIEPDAKIITIEDTAEVQVPHPNWIREVTRPPKPGEEGTGVGMFDLLRAALRQRPDEIIIGEIRGEEGLIAFQAMQTGHAVMATFHASTVEKLIQRLTGSPILVPKTYIENLNIIVIQSQVKLPNGKLGRRAMSINEIIGYDTATDSFSFTEVFRWDPVKDEFEFTGDMNSYLLEYKIAPMRGIPPHKKRQIYSLLKRRARILEKLSQNGVSDYNEFYKVISKAQKEGIF